MELTITFLMITDCFCRKHRRGSHISKIAWKPVKFHLYLIYLRKVYANKTLSVKPLSSLCSLHANTFFGL